MNNLNENITTLSAPTLDNKISNWDSTLFYDHFSCCHCGCHEYWDLILPYDYCCCYCCHCHSEYQYRYDNWGFYNSYDLFYEYPFGGVDYGYSQSVVIIQDSNKSTTPDVPSSGTAIILGASLLVAFFYRRR